MWVELIRKQKKAENEKSEDGESDFEDGDDDD